MYIHTYTQKSADVRKQQLVDSFEAQQYFADALEAELRIKELEPVVRSSDFGKDKDMADVSVITFSCI